MAANRVKQVSLLQIGRGILAMQRSVWSVIPKMRAACVDAAEIRRAEMEIAALIDAANRLELLDGQTAGHLTQLALTAEAENN